MDPPNGRKVSRPVRKSMYDFDVDNLVDPDFDSMTEEVLRDVLRRSYVNNVSFVKEIKRWRAG